MSDPASRRHVLYPLTALREVADAATRERILLGAVRELRETKGAIHEAIRRGLSNRIPGFQNPLKAPGPKLARELDYFLFRQAAPTSDLVGLWIESVDGFEASVEEFLDSVSDDPRVTGLLGAAPDSVVAEKLFDLADAYLERFPGGDRRAIAIALGHSVWERLHEGEIEEAEEEAGLDEEETTDIAGNEPLVESSAGASDGNSAPVSQEERLSEIEALLGPPPETLHASLFARFMAELGELPGTAAEWDELPGFMAALLHARARAMEEAAGVRAQLIERLRRMPAQHAGAMEFIEYRPPFESGELGIRTVDVGALESLCDAVEERLSELGTALSNLPTRSGFKEWHARTDDLAGQIRNLLARIEALVGEPRPSEPETVADQASGGVTGEAVAATDVAVAAVAGPAAPDAPAHAASVEDRAEEATPSSPSCQPEGVADSGAVTAEEPRREEPAVATPELQPVVRIATGPAPAVVAVEPVMPAEAGDGWSAFMCDLVGDGDLAGAYWLACSLGDSGVALPFPDWLLAAAQAGPWLAHDSDAFVPELLDLAGSRQPAGAAEHLLALSVALKAAVIQPATGLAVWLRPQELHHSALREMCEATAQFATYNTALHPDDLLGLSGAAAVAAVINALSVEARKSLDAAAARGWKMRRAHDVWLYFARRELPNLLEPVAADQRERVAAVRSALEKWRRARDVQEWIEEVDAKLSHRPKRPIVGDPRDQILRRVRDCYDIARRWCELVERAAVTQTRGNWLLERVRALQSALAVSLPRADAELRELAAAAQPAPIAAAARTLRRAVTDLAATLQLPVRVDVEPPACDARLLRVIEDAPELERALATRLLWLPEVELESDGRPRPGSLPRIAQALQVAAQESRSLSDAYKGWISRQDFRFVDRLAGVLADDPKLAALQGEMSRAREAARAALKAEVGRTQDAIEQAFVDGVISDRRAEYAALTEFDIQDVQECAPRFAGLVRIREELGAARRARLAHSRERWRRLETELAVRFSGAQWEGVRSFVDSLVDRDDRALLECLERLEDVQRGHLALPEDWIEGPGARDPFAEFLATLPELEAVARDGLAQFQRTVRDKGASFRDFSRFPEPRLREADRALESWMGLKSGAWSTSAIASRLGGILEFVGFTLSSDVNRLVVASEGPDWAHVRARMSASNLSPVPQFGSQARGLYDVLCVRERPGVDVLGARLRDTQLEGHPVIVVYLARLPLNRRRELNRLTRRSDLPIVAVDEPLLLFLAGERDARLPVFLRCALPYSSVNPFTPAQAGDVPPEMFYGRREMVRELERPEGGCVVYGGRQLGKSVLLRRVERDLHVPERASYARVIDIKLVGDPHSDIPVDEVWRRVREAFKDFELLHPRVTGDQPREIIRHIRDVLRKREIKQIVLLFDEADAFLDADSRQGFRVVTELRDLMTDSRRKFKVVFAGLQNVQRFQGIPNQPLAHFGQPIRVGPLEPEAAERLVREPLHALGYRFAEASGVLRVLSYTNYHPGLIQLFCQQLLRAHRSSAAATLPPYVIEGEDVERVYRQPLVRDSIRDRFDWTLGLDPRYQCTAWAMIVDQISDRDSYARAYAAREALALVRSYWPQGFSDMNLDRYRAILDEMEGLGVLRRTAEGDYRLRSPNLVRLMGREADIEERLIELAQRTGVPTFDADSYRALLDGEGDSRSYSPLTYADGRRVAPPQSGVSLAFGSPALGIDVLPAAIERALFGPAGERGPRLLTGLGACGADVERLRGQLHRYVQANQRYDRLGAVEVVAEGDASVVARVEGAWGYCQERAERRGNAPFRIVFVFPPAAALEWLSGDDRVLELESRIGAVTSLGLWNASGLRRRLEQQDKIASDVQCRRLLEATGGWPPLVDEVFKRCGRSQDIQPAADDVRADVDNGGPLTRSLIDRVGLAVSPRARAVLHFVRELGAVGADEVLPELIDPSLSEAECRTLVEWLSRMSLLGFRDGRWLVDPIVARVLSVA